MKSRILISHSKSSVPLRSKFRLSATRRFALQRVPSCGRNARRNGQALLLAVLIMLLAALLSAGFLAVLSGNLNQTARISDKTRAIEASRAGVQFANQQLSYSKAGDKWRPVDASPAPVPNDPTNFPNYNDYYSQLDKVQGWANTLLTTDPNYRSAFAKFPDPNQPTGNAPKFLLKVEEIPTDPTATDYEAEHAGEIKITSIGLSDDDPNVFHKTVAYKTGRKQLPWSVALRSVSNWDFNYNKGLGTVRQAEVSAVTPDATTKTTQVTVPDAKRQGTFPDAPFNVVLSHKDTNPANSATFGAVVTAVTASGGSTTYTLSGEAPTAFTAGDTLQVAAALGTADTIDLLNTGQTPTASYPQTFPTQNQPNGILANGSLWLQGQIQLTALQQAGSKIQSSGAISLLGTKTVPAGSDVATTGDLAPSSDSTFPGNFVTTSGVNKTDLVNDAWNRLNGPKPLGLDYTGTTRSIEPFKPVSITSKNNLKRYLALTRDSDTDSNGYQEGVYIDNKDDVEKVGTTAMTQKQLVDMLLSPTAATPVDYTRNGTAVAAGTVGSSLEQKHLRGWVGPDEFLPRGALVELSPDPDLTGASPSIRVTLDARADSTTAAPDNDLGPVASKAWRNTDGTPDLGVYTKILPWPANGTIFAEGNLRIRGDVGTATAPRSLTVVSLGNIYIEGSVSVDNSTPSSDRKKLMLLAKKNVIVNPTRAIIARTDVQTVVINTGVSTTGTPAVPANFDLPVANGYAFNVGDYIAIDTLRGVVTARAEKLLRIRTTATQTIPVNAIVRSPLETREQATDTTGTPLPVRAFYSLVDTEKAFNRRLVAPIILDSPNRNKLDLDHVADLRQTGSPAVTAGLNIKAEDSVVPPASRPSPFVAELTNKQPLLSSTQDLDPTELNVRQADKILRTYNSFTAGNQKDFTNNATPPPDKTLTQFAADISQTTEANTTPPPPEGYKYDATLTDPAIGVLPYYALAGVGLRYAPGATYTAGSNLRQDFNTTEGFTIPVATSIQYDQNGTLTTIRPLTSGLAVKYFGFAPTYAGSEDALTVDSSFYQKKEDISKSTLDPRILNVSTFPTFSKTLTTNADIGYSLVLRRTEAFSGTNSSLLPDYRVRSMKLENIDLTGSGFKKIKPVADSIKVNAFIYAQEGSWFVIPGDYFRSNPPVRATVDASGNFKGSYIDSPTTGIQGAPDPGEYILDSSNREVADLNRNGSADSGEREAALRFVRYNYAPIQVFGAIVENQTAVVADVKDAGGTTIAKGAVQDWMDKWAAYDDTPSGATQGDASRFEFINYAYDPALANGSSGADELRVPVTTDLLYEQ